MSESRPAWIGLGGNLGDPADLMARAVAKIQAEEGVEVTRRSSIYRSEPWGDVGQPDFLNAVIEVDTVLAPQDLLERLLGIEKSLGRERNGRRWGPRLIDIDLLMVGDLECATPKLQLPHPRMHQRRFVLAPLAEIAPDAVMPGRGAVREHLDGLRGQAVERLDKFP